MSLRRRLQRPHRTDAAGRLSRASVFGDCNRRRDRVFTAERSFGTAERRHRAVCLVTSRGNQAHGRNGRRRAGNGSSTQRTRRWSEALKSPDAGCSLEHVAGSAGSRRDGKSASHLWCGGGRPGRQRHRPTGAPFGVCRSAASSQPRLQVGAASHGGLGASASQHVGGARGQAVFGPFGEPGRRSRGSHIDAGATSVAANTSVQVLAAIRRRGRRKCLTRWRTRTAVGDTEPSTRFVAWLRPR